MQKTLCGLLLALICILPFTSSCATTSDGQRGLQTLESMPEDSFTRVKILSSLVVKIAASSYLREGRMAASELILIADALETLANTSAVGGTRLFIQEILSKGDLTSLEAEVIVSVVVGELEAQGLFEKLGIDGTLDLTPRTREYVDALVDAVRTAVLLTGEELNAISIPE